MSTLNENDKVTLREMIISYLTESQQLVYEHREEEAIACLNLVKILLVKYPNSLNRVSTIDDFNFQLTAMQLI